MSDFPLMCLPFAGSGAGFYRRWAKEEPTAGLAVLPAQLPGREELFHEELHTDVADAAAYLVHQVTEATGTSAYALFGHSLGAVLCYEVTHELARSGFPMPAHVFVSGSPGPQQQRTARATGLDDVEFIARVQDFAGYRHAAFDDPALRELLLPVLRADVAMHEDYKPSTSRPLSVPVTSLRGAEDTLVSADEAQQWRTATRAEFDYVELPGGHMYLADSPRLLLRTVSECLR